MSRLGHAPGTETTCKNGHLYVGDNVLVHRDGTRKCKACAKDAQARTTARKRAARAAQQVPDLPRMDFVDGDLACRHADPRLFEPVTQLESGESGGRPLMVDRIQVALSYCDLCPVVAGCLEWALATGEQGVWGGRYLSRASRGKKGAA